MQTAPNLDYSKRFGNEVNTMQTIAARAAADAAKAQERVIGPTKYSRWFFGEENQNGTSVAKPQLRPIDIGRMAAAEIAEITMSNLGILGDENWTMFSAKLPAQSMLRKDIKASLVNRDTPWLGSCKIGKVVGEAKDGLVSVQQFFIGNFDAEINTSGKGSPYQLRSRDFHQTFYGIHMLLDRLGNFKGFDTSKGEDGVAFHTEDVREAHFAIASAALGLSVEKLKEITARNAAAKRV